MIKRLAGCIREYKRSTILTPLFMVGEVVCECIIPLLTADLINAIQTRCTVDVIVQSRRKAGWQGIVCQPDGRMIDQFDSELELLKLLTKEVKKQQEAVNQ